MDNAELTPVFDEAAIQARIMELGHQISGDYPDGNVIFIGILKGAFVFLADLVRALSKPCQIEFVRISSYGCSKTSSGCLNILLDIAAPIEGRDVILVDDIVDTGLTLNQYRERLLEKNPRSLKIAALINKTGRREKSVSLDYCGFDIDRGFLVGYGLDCDEKFRNLSAVYSLDASH
jgi:hypoxanthine phosphoribosyltransferase